MNYKHLFPISLLLLLTFLGCKSNKQQQTEKAVDTIPMLINRVQKCSKLYTIEYKIHKIITHDDEKAIKGKLFNENINIEIPLTKRRVAIPMDATLKGYIDFADFSNENVKRNGEKIEIILPDPRITLTSTKIDHDQIRKYVSFTRSDFSDAELSDFERQGRQQILQAIPQTDILENARISATRILVPILQQLGFKEQNITISFRNDLHSNDLSTLIDKTFEHGK